jgi:ubiquinone/menaquinone biosynthesis C-methylase UbiE
MTVQRELDVEGAVRARYSGAARSPEASLCCPTNYPKELLRAIPEEVLERDYGCGNPSEHLEAGETVLDLGSGSGKICFIASQIVGPTGRVIGIDENPEMLSLARRAAAEVASRVGYQNVEFLRGRIQDLALDLDALDAWLKERPVRCVEDLSALKAQAQRLRVERPLIADGSIDVVVSNCVLNLVRSEDKVKLFRQIARVLQKGGRAVISDIVSDEDVPERLTRDPELWSGCISGALREDHFLEAFAAAGLYGITLCERQNEPWRIIQGIEFRSVTVVAYKGKEGPCIDQKHAVLYKGPFSDVRDDDGHVFPRGVPIAVCEKTFGILSQIPYRAHFELVPPHALEPLEQCQPFPCNTGPIRRDPRETKGEGYLVTTGVRSLCPDDGSCC